MSIKLLPIRHPPDYGICLQQVSQLRLRLENELQQLADPPDWGTAGESHDQAEAEWIEIRTQLMGHNDTPFGSGRSSGVFCMF
jgi:hypothetical protein